MRGGAAALVGACLTAAAPALATGDLGALLEGLTAPAKRPQGTVAVTGWVEATPTGPELVVRVEPQGAAKLVAEPGVTVTPLQRAGVTWPDEPAVREEAGAGYFKAPVELRLPFSARDAGPVEASVEYAYCLVDYQCLFGEAMVTALAPSACRASPGSGSTAAC